jgi:uncharacterized protein YjbJ (UPF0337 family)
MIMNKDIFEGNWKQLKGEVQKQWGKLTDDHMDQINGSREKLAGALQKTYGIAREDAERQLKEWEETRKKVTKAA